MVSPRTSALCLVAAGCGAAGSPSDDARADACPMSVEAGHQDGDGFVPYRRGDDAEVVQGFQGFLFLDLALRVHGTTADRAEVAASIEIEGASTSWLRQTVALVEGPGDHRYAHEVQVFFNTSSLLELLDRPAHATLSVEAEGCLGVQELDLVLVNHESCVSQPDGGLLCADGG